MTAVAKLLLLDYLPVLGDIVSQRIMYLQKQPQTIEPLLLPRFLDHHPFTILGSLDPHAEQAAGVPCSPYACSLDVTAYY